MSLEHQMLATDLKLGCADVLDPTRRPEDHLVHLLDIERLELTIALEDPDRARSRRFCCAC